VTGRNKTRMKERNRPKKRKQRVLRDLTGGGKLEEASNKKQEEMRRKRRREGGFVERRVRTIERGKSAMRLYRIEPGGNHRIHKGTKVTR